MGWTLASQTRQFDAKPGQDLVTETHESLDPSPAFSWHPQAISREISSQDGITTAKQSYYATGDGTEESSYTIRGALSQEPIATHPMFQSGDYKVDQDEWKKYRKWQADPASTTWAPDNDEASDAFKKFYGYIERGIENFLSGTVEIQVTEIQRGAPQLRALGKRDAPPRAPALPNGRDWLVVGVDADRLVGARGATEWRVTRTYRASMDGGWDATIYKG